MNKLNKNKSLNVAKLQFYKCHNSKTNKKLNKSTNKELMSE